MFAKLSGECPGKVREMFGEHLGEKGGVWILLPDYKSPHAVAICDTLVNKHAHRDGQLCQVVLLVQPVELKVTIKPNTMH